MSCLFRTPAVLWRCGCEWRSWRTSPHSSVWARSGTGMAMRQNFHNEIFLKLEFAKWTFQGFFLLAPLCPKMQGECLMLLQLTLVNFKHILISEYPVLLHNGGFCNGFITTQQMCHIMVLFNDCSKIKDENNKISNVLSLSEKYLLFLYEGKSYK